MSVLFTSTALINNLQDCPGFYFFPVCLSGGVRGIRVLSVLKAVTRWRIASWPIADDFFFPPPQAATFQAFSPSVHLYSFEFVSVVVGLLSAAR